MNLKHLSIALALVAILSVGMTVPVMQQNAYATVTYTIADQTNSATGQAVYSGGKTAMVEFITDDSRLTLQEVDCLTVSLRKQGSPTGTAYIGFLDSSLNVIYQFGTKDVSTLTTSYTLYEFCNTSNSGYLIPYGSDHRFGVKYTGGDSNNYIDVRRSNIGSGPDFEGTDSYKQYYTTSWHSNTGEDLLFKLTNTGTDEYDFCDQLPQDLMPYFYQSTALWQNNGYGRCFGQALEASGNVVFAAATLSSNDLQIYTVASYEFDGDDGLTPVYGTYVAVYDGSTFLTSGFTGTSGEYNLLLSDLSVGTHIINIRVPHGIGGVMGASVGADDTITCDPSSTVTCYNGNEEPEDTWMQWGRFYVTVS